MSILLQSAILEEKEKGNIVVDPWNPKQLNPNSYNVRLHNRILEVSGVSLENSVMSVEDESFPSETWDMNAAEGMILFPGRLYLGCTIEYTEAHGNLVPMLEGRSSLARLGLSIHSTAGFGDVGFCGRWTLELSVVFPLKIYPEMEIGQIYWIRGEGDAPEYSGKYQGSQSVELSQMYREAQD